MQSHYLGKIVSTYVHRVVVIYYSNILEPLSRIFLMENFFLVQERVRGTCCTMLSRLYIKCFSLTH